jgi:hypothetical protein
MPSYAVTELLDPPLEFLKRQFSIDASLHAGNIFHKYARGQEMLYEVSELQK